MSRIGQDIKVATRALLRARFVSILALVAFALGIGVTTAVFSIFNGVLLKPLPFPKPEQLVMVYGTQPACATCPASFPKYHDWRERNRVFSAIGGSTGASFVLTGQEMRRASAHATTASLADVFAVPRHSGASTRSRKISRADRKSSCCRRLLDTPSRGRSSDSREEAPVRRRAL
jgi:hypothetical protein